MLDASDLSSQLTPDEKTKILSVELNPLLSYSVWTEFSRNKRQHAMAEMKRLKLYGADPHDEGQRVSAEPAQRRDCGLEF